MQDASSSTTLKPGQGQWAAGDRTPLNPNEAMKADDDGLNVRERVETVYALEGFASIPGARWVERFSVERGRDLRFPSPWLHEIPALFYKNSPDPIAAARISTPALCSNS